MRNFLVFSSILAAASALGCDGSVEEEEERAKACAAPPRAPVTTTGPGILRLDAVDLAERDRRFDSVGMNLDSTCTTLQTSTFACQPILHGVRRADGHDGIDNAFGRGLVPLLMALDGRPSESASGTSYLVFEGEGRARLLLGARSGHVRAVIPLTAVRLEDTHDGFVTLAAIASRKEVADNVRARAHALEDPPNVELCTPDSIRVIGDAVEQNADIPLSGVANAQQECDGISVAFRFRGEAAAEAPALPPTCAELAAEE